MKLTLLITVLALLISGQVQAQSMQGLMQQQRQTMQMPGFGALDRNRSQRAPSPLEQEKPEAWELDFKLQRYMDYYFLNKPVFLTPIMLQRLIDHGYMDQEPHEQHYVIGFLSTLFADNPSLVMDWLEQLEMTQYQAGTFIRAMRHAGQVEMIDSWLSSKAEWDYPKGTMFEPLPAPLDDELNSPEDIQRFWGAYIASGDDEYLQLLFDRFLETDGEITQAQINNADIEAFKKQAVHEVLQGLFVTAGTQYKDVREFIREKASMPAYAENEDVMILIARITRTLQEREQMLSPF